MTDRVYHITPDYIVDRPNMRKIFLKGNYDKLHQHLTNVLEGSEDEDSKRPKIKVPAKATKYDYYYISDFDGLWSEKLLTVLSSYVPDTFSKAGIYLNGSLFYVLLAKKKDYLDKKKSVCEYFDDTKKKVMMVTKYVFNKKKVPKLSLFKLPYGGSFLMCSSEMKKVVDAGEFRGIAFQDVEKVGVVPSFLK